MDTWYIDTWQHLMGSLDAVLDDARGNAATIRESHAAIEDLLGRAEQERAAAEAALHDLAAKRQRLSDTLDEMQRQLALAGVPLRGEIS